MELHFWLVVGAMFLALFGLRFVADRRLEQMRCHNKALTNQVFKLIEECDRLQTALAKERAAVLAAKEQKPPEH